jgi:hypothetical protein
MFSDQKSVLISHLTHACYMHNPPLLLIKEYIKMVQVW